MFHHKSHFTLFYSQIEPILTSFFKNSERYLENMKAHLIFHFETLLPKFCAVTVCGEIAFILVNMSM